MGTKKHIVFFCEHLFLGGAPQAQVEFLRGIDLNRYDVSLVLEKDPGVGNHLRAQIPSSIPVRVLFPEDDASFPKGKYGFFLEFLRKRNEKIDTILRIKEILDGLKPANVLIGFTLTFAKFLPFFRKYKLVYWIHGPKSHMGWAELYKFYQRIRHFDKIVVVSEFLESQIKGLLPKLANRVQSIYTPIDFEFIGAKAHDFSELSASELELINKKFYVAVARFVPEKDIQCLVKTWSLLKKQGFTSNLIVVGDGNGRADIEKLVKDLSIQDQVHLVGAKRNPYVWMSKSVAFVHAAKSEGFGLVLVEAMSLAKAVISSDCPVGPSEILQNGHSGLLVKIGDERDFAEKILQIDQNVNLRSEMQERALIRARDFSSKRVLPDFYKLIDSL